MKSNSSIIKAFSSEMKSPYSTSFITVIPSIVGMFVYKLETSMVASRHLFHGTLLSFTLLFKSVVSRINDLPCWAYGLSNWSMIMATGWKMEPIGFPSEFEGFLCILGSVYIMGTCGCVGKRCLYCLSVIIKIQSNTKI